MKRILVAFIVFGTVNSWATKKCPSIPWSWSIRTLANKSEWVVVGTIDSEVAELPGRFKYKIKVKEVIKGDQNQSTFETKPFVKSEKISMVSKSDSCDASVNLSKESEYIFFSENKNFSSIMDADEKHKKLVRDALK